MSQWQIDPAGVRSILESTLGAQEQLQGALTEQSIQGVFDGLGSGGIFTAEVPNAVSELMQDQQHNLKVISNRIRAGIDGVTNATISYQNGQEEMAAEFHREMLESSADGDFTFFERHGYQEDA